MAHRGLETGENIYEIHREKKRRNVDKSWYSVQKRIDAHSIFTVHYQVQPYIQINN